MEKCRFNILYIKKKNNNKTTHHIFLKDVIYFRYTGLQNEMVLEKLWSH